MVGIALTGTHRVRATYPAFHDVNKLFRTTRDKIEIRRQALKLRYWPEKHPTDDSGCLLDLDWSWVRALRDKNIGELRINDTIGGFNNLRIIFFEGAAAAVGSLPIVWVLRVMQKKRDDFSVHDLTTFKARRELIIERFYRLHSFE